MLSAVRAISCLFIHTHSPHPSNGLKKGMLVRLPGDGSFAEGLKVSYNFLFDLATARKV